MAAEPKGYRVEWKPGDPCYLSPADYERETHKAGADVWPLFAEPQSGCKQEIEVYHGWCWVRPRHVSALRDMTGYAPLYLGPLIQRGRLAEEVAHLFPSMVEDRLRQARPDLYPHGVPGTRAACFDPTLLGSVPRNVLEAERTLAQWFAAQGAREWRLGDCQSRTYGVKEGGNAA